MTPLLARAFTTTIGGTDAKMALVCLASRATGVAGMKGEVLGDAVEDAFKASELNRAQFKAALGILRARNLIAVATKRDLAGEKVLVAISVDLSGAASDDGKVEIIGEETPSQQMWRETLAYLRETGTTEAKGRPLVGRLLKSAKGDPYAVVNAVRAARRAQPYDPFLWMTKHLTSAGANNGSGVSAALERAAERASAGG
jgi:hypothetical protein